MDIIDIIEGGFVNPSDFSGEIIIKRSLVKKLCEATGCIDEKLMRNQLSALLNGIKKQKFWDKSGSSEITPTLKDFSDRVLYETVHSQRKTTYDPINDGLGGEFSMAVVDKNYGKMVSM